MGFAWIRTRPGSTVAGGADGGSILQKRQRDGNEVTQKLMSQPRIMPAESGCLPQESEALHVQLILDGTVL